MTGILTTSEATSSVPEVVAAFLTQFGIALHKTRAYPAGHPMREEAVRRAHAGLGPAFQGGSTLRVAVGRRQLTIDGAGTDSDHFVLRDLAARLNRRHIGALVFHAGASESDLDQTIASLCAERDPDEVATPEVAGAIELIPVSFSSLSLAGKGGGAAERVEALWRDLANQALGAGAHRGGGRGKSVAPGSDGVATDDALLRGPQELAQALIERVADPKARPAAAEAIEGLARATTALDGPERVQLEVRLRHLLAALPPESLSGLLELNLESGDGLEHLMPAVEWLPVSAALELVERASQTQEGDISTSLLRLLRKLAATGGGSDGDQTGDPDVRAILQSLLSSWTLVSPNPLHHTQVLDHLAQRDVTSAHADASASEGLRLVQMALETGAFGDQVIEGVELAIEAGDVTPLVRALEGGPDSAAAGQVWDALIAPANLRRVVTECRAELSVLTSLLARVGPDGFDTLFDLVLVVDDRHVRRPILERLVGMASVQEDRLSQALDGLPEHLLRRVLGHLAELSDLPVGLDVTRHLGSTDPMVRLAAYRLTVRDPAKRDEAIMTGLADKDERVVRFLVDTAAGAHLPRAALARLMLLLNSPGRSPELKARAIPLLAQLEAPSVRQWLVDRMLVRRGWFRRLRLAPKSAIVLAKLRVLAVRWSDHPEAQRILKRAAAASDADLQAAARGADSP